MLQHHHQNSTTQAAFFYLLPTLVLYILLREINVKMQNMPIFFHLLAHFAIYIVKIISVI